MRLAQSEAIPWSPVRGVRGGTIGFKILLEGEEGSKNNYQLLLAKTDRTFKSPRHRHNFDQLRYALNGLTNYGPKRNLEVDDLAYFPEGTYYGPQNQEEVGTDSLSMVIQFGGPSGSGYMSKSQLDKTFDRLTVDGQFAEGVYRRRSPGPDGRVNQDAYEAIWEAQNDRPIEYSKPRFLDPIHFREGNFEWQQEGAPGVCTKSIGTFTEKGVSVRFVRLEAKAAYQLPTGQQRQIIFIKSGSGSVGSGEQWSSHTAIDVAASESVELRANTPAEAMILQLPSL